MRVLLQDKSTLHYIGQDGLTPNHQLATDFKTGANAVNFSIGKTDLRIIYDFQDDYKTSDYNLALMGVDKISAAISRASGFR